MKNYKNFSEFTPSLVYLINILTTQEPHVFQDDHHEVLKSIRSSRIILPVLIGLAVVGYLLYKQFDPSAFAQINWNIHTLFWLSLAVIILVIKHLSYATRLYILSRGEFSFIKCIELIFIWEFSSAVSPTAIGGSAVALFVLSQEKLKAARVAAIVLYTIVLDTAYFVFSLPLLLLIIGPSMIRADLTSLSTLDGWAYTFILTYIFMGLYGLFFYYGLFVRPEHSKWLLSKVTTFGFLKRYHLKAIKLGEDFVIASQELKIQSKKFHLRAFLMTALAWSMRFALIMALIYGLIDSVKMDPANMLKLYARLESMFVIMLFSPTPGGAGFAEFVFGGFLVDFVPTGVSLIVAFLWRLLAYYSYLLAGVIIVPNWIRKIINARKAARLAQENQSLADNE